MLRREMPVMGLLRGRAEDVNAGVAQVEHQSNVRPNCTVIARRVTRRSGDAARRWRCAAVPGRHRPIDRGQLLQHHERPHGQMFDAMDHISAPILLQHAANDSLVPVAVSAQLAVHAHSGGRHSRHVQAVPRPARRVEGHELMQPRYSSTWKPDVVQFLGDLLANCA